MFSLKLTPLLFLLMAMIAACQNEPQEKELDTQQLIGRWEIIEGWRNGRVTETLTGTYYEFSNGEKMRTNLTHTGVEDDFEFKVSGNQIEQKSKPPVIYTIEVLNDSLLEMSMVIRNLPFKLKLGKVKPI